MVIDSKESCCCSEVREEVCSEGGARLLRDDAVSSGSDGHDAADESEKARWTGLVEVTLTLSGTYGILPRGKHRRRCAKGKK